MINFCSGYVSSYEARSTLTAVPTYFSNVKADKYGNYVFLIASFQLQHIFSTQHAWKASKQNHVIDMFKL